MTSSSRLKRVVIVGGGFAGLNAAKRLGNVPGVEVTLVDRRNHHLFQPLLYQVATAGLSPADIAAPIRSLLSRYRNVRVYQGNVKSVDFGNRNVQTDFATLPYDYLILACGADTNYFGNSQWREFAPSLKSIEDATEIRRRILLSFELAERTEDRSLQHKYMTFVVVGGGPTGVELAGAIGEMSRYTLARDFRRINSKLTRVFLIEAGPQILSAFPPELADRAVSDLESLGVQVWTSSLVTGIDQDGVDIGDERIRAATVIWAAGVRAAKISTFSGLETDRQGRIHVADDLSVPADSNVFIAGDMAHVTDDEGQPLPGLAPVAKQQGEFLASLIRDELNGKPRKKFRYRDKGMMATIGRNRAVAVVGRRRLTGRVAWLAWLVVHIYFLSGFRNRLFVFLSWSWSYFTYRRGARLIVGGDCSCDMDDCTSSDDRTT